MADKIKCELVSWEHFYALARDLAFQIYDAGYVPDMIIAVARGGYMPGRVLCDFLDIMDLNTFRVEHYHGAHKEPLARIKYPLATNVEGKRVLVVDDVSDTGDTFVVAIEHIRKHGEPAEIKTATLQHKTVSHFEPDFYAQIVTQWRWIIYPWAVTEDVSGFINAMKPNPVSVNDISERLLRDYGIEVPQQSLLDILKLQGHPLG